MVNLNVTCFRVATELKLTRALCWTAANYTIMKGTNTYTDNSISSETMQLISEISNILGTGLNQEQLAISVKLIEMGINPNALANIIRILQRESAAIAET